MGKRRYGLRDDQWEWIKDFLPGRAGTEARPAKDDRLFAASLSSGQPLETCRNGSKTSTWCIRGSPDGPSVRFIASVAASGQRRQQRIRDDDRHNERAVTRIVPEPAKGATKPWSQQRRSEYQDPCRCRRAGQSALSACDSSTRWTVLICACTDCRRLWSSDTGFDAGARVSQPLLADEQAIIRLAPSASSHATKTRIYKASAGRPTVPTRPGSSSTRPHSASVNS